MTKISALPAGTAIQPADIFPFDQAGVTKQATAAQIATLAGATGTTVAALLAAAALTGTEIVPVDQGGNTVRTTTAAIATLAGAGSVGPTGATGPTGPAGGGGTVLKGCRVYRSTAQTIPDRLVTPISFDTERWDDDNYWAIGSPTRLTIPASGTYIVGGLCAFVTNATARRAGDIMVNGTTLIHEDSGGSAGLIGSGDTALTTGSTMWKFTVGDYVQFRVYHDRGSPLDTLASDAAPNAHNCEFWIQRLV